jgi:hypothetical protein
VSALQTSYSFSDPAEALAAARFSGFAEDAIEASDTAESRAAGERAGTNGGRPIAGTNRRKRAGWITVTGSGSTAAASGVADSA